MALIRALSGSSGGWGNFDVITDNHNRTSFTYTLSDLVVGKKYLLIYSGLSSQTTYLNQRLNISNIVGGTYETIIPITTYSAGSNIYVGYVAYLLTATATSIDITTQDYGTSDFYMLYEVA